MKTHETTNQRARPGQARKSSRPQKHHPVGPRQKDDREELAAKREVDGAMGQSNGSRAEKARGPFR